MSIRDGATVQLRKNARIMCWIPSVESQLLKKVKAVNDTWVRRCDGHVFFVNTSIQLPDVKNLNVPDGRQHLTAKSMQAFEYLYHHHLQDYDWFLKGDDDAYIVLENLRLLMSQYDPAKPVYLGHLYKSHLKAGYMSGGASYALSREALRLLHDEGIVKVRREHIPPPQHTHTHTQNMSTVTGCLERGVCSPPCSVKANTVWLVGSSCS